MSSSDVSGDQKCWNGTYFCLAIKWDKIPGYYIWDKIRVLVIEFVKTICIYCESKTKPTFWYTFTNEMQCVAVNKQKEREWERESGVVIIISNIPASEVDDAWRLLWRPRLGRAREMRPKMSACGCCRWLPGHPTGSTSSCTRPRRPQVQPPTINQSQFQFNNGLHFQA